MKSDCEAAQWSKMPRNGIVQLKRSSCHPANHKGGTGMLKIGKTLGIGTGTVQRVLMRPFVVDVAEAAFASQ